MFWLMVGLIVVGFALVAVLYREQHRILDAVPVDDGLRGMVIAGAQTGLNPGQMVTLRNVSGDPIFEGRVTTIVHRSGAPAELVIGSLYE